MLLSVVICTYNRRDYLIRCLQELLKSSLSSEAYEILIIDNNSSDDTMEVVDSFKQRVSNISYVQEPQQGLSYARNRAIKEAQGTYLLYLDDDALINEKGLEELNYFLEQNPGVAVVGGRCVIEYESEKPSWLTKKSEDWIGSFDFGDEALDVNFENLKARKVRYPIGACFCVEKEFLSSLGGFDPKLGRIKNKLLAGEESLVNLQAQKRLRRIVYLPQIWVRHLIQPERLSKKSLYAMTFYCGVSDYLLRLRVYSFVRVFGFSMFRFAFLVKNILDYIFYSLCKNEEKRFDSRFLMNFNFGYMIAFLGFCKNG